MKSECRFGSWFVRSMVITVLLVFLSPLTVLAETRVNEVCHIDYVGGSVHCHYDPVTYTENVVWTLAGSPYILQNNVSVAAGVALTIEPGVQVLVVDDKGLYVSGTLTATQATFSRAGGGHWLGIYLGPTAVNSNLTDCAISYAGSQASFGWINNAYRRSSIYVDGSSPQITGCTISESAAHGIELYSGAATVTTTAFSNMTDGWYPIVLDHINTFPIFSGNSTSGTGLNMVYLPSGTLDQSAHWTNPGINFPYHLHDTSIAPGVTLTVDAGTVVKAAGNAIVLAGGALAVAGTEAQPVLFTADTLTPGHWRGIYLSPTAGGSSLNHLTIAYAGSTNSLGWIHDAYRKASLYVDMINPTFDHLTIRDSLTIGLSLFGANAVMTNVAIQNSGWNGLTAESGSRASLTAVAITGNGAAEGVHYAIATDASSVLNLTGFSFSGNTRQGYQVWGGTIPRDALWKNLGATMPYAVTGLVTVAAGATLTIQPGAIIKLWDTQLSVAGVLTANSATGRITFTSLQDDTIGGDTNGDGNQTTPAKGDWRGIYLSPESGSSILVNCNLIYAGSQKSLGWINNDYRRTAIYVNGSSPQITGCSISESAGHGIELYGASATVTNTAFSNMAEGWYPLALDHINTFPILSGNSTNGTGMNMVYLPSGTLALPEGVTSITRHWNLPGANFPYHLFDVMIAEGVTLTVDAGTTVKGATNARLWVNGNLAAVGTGAQPVLFTADTQTPGHWRGIYLSPTAGGSSLNYLTIAYAGSTSSLGWFHNNYRQAALYVDLSSPNFDHLTIRDSLTHGLALYGSDAVMTNVVIQNNGWNGLNAESGSRASLTTVSFTGNGSGGAYYTIATDASSVLNLTDFSFSGNTRQAYQIWGGTIPSNALWKNLGGATPYAVTGSVTVGAGVTLTIQPGSIIKLWDTQLSVAGVLTANSTTGRITFTSLQDDTIGGDTNGDGAATAPGRGDWRGIYLSPDSGGSTLTNCNLSYSGSQQSLGWFNSDYRRTAIYVDGSSPQITGCSISESAGHGIELYSGSAMVTNTAFSNMAVNWYPLVLDHINTFPILSGNSTSGTGMNMVYLPSGTLTQSAHWNKPGANFPYHLHNLVIAEGVALTVDAGTVVKGAGNAIISVGGALNAAGTVAQPVLFTADTETPGHWRGIYLSPTAGGSTLNNATIAYAGSLNSLGWIHDTYRCAALYLDTISPPLTNVTIRDSATIGLSLYAASPAITAARFQSCAWDELNAEAGSQPVIRQSSFIGGSSNLGLNNLSPSVVIDARNNYWGAASGPYHPTSNPSGAGVRVSDGVNYADWRAGDGFLLTVVMAGTGTGMVNSDSVIHCPGVCSGYYQSADTVLLMPTEGDSIFKGWAGGGCSGTGNCQVTVSGDTTVTATFDLAPLIRIDGPTPKYYTTLQAACNDVIANNTVIQAREHEFVEIVVYGKPYSVNLLGGYDKTFTTRPGKSSIKGKLTLGGGKVIVDNIIVK